jgi:predicted PurR-regulated permease PerM
MTRKRLYNTLLVLLTFIAFIVLLRLLWDILAVFADLLLMFAVAWLIAFILRPVARWMAEGRLALLLLKAIHKRWGARRAHWIGQLLDPIAVTIVYLLLLGAVIVTVVAFIPVVVSQSRQLVMALVDYLQHAPEWIAAFQTDIAVRFNVPPDLVNQFYQPDEIGRRAAAVVEIMPRLLANLIRGIASGVGEALLVLALSYYLMLDGRRVSKQIQDLVPQRFQDEYELTTATIDRAFGGFLRGEVVMALLSGVVTTIAAGVAGVRSSLIVGAIAGLVIFIPLIGAPIAMFMPSLVALIQGAPLSSALLLLAFLTVFQQILLHLIVPRIMSESVGMPSLLTLISVLIGVRLWGVWGFIFGIPVAGAVYTIGLVLLRRFKRAQDELDQERPPDDAPSI